MLGVCIVFVWYHDQKWFWQGRVYIYIAEVFLFTDFFPIANVKGSDLFFPLCFHWCGEKDKSPISYQTRRQVRPYISRVFAVSFQVVTPHANCLYPYSLTCTEGFVTIPNLRKSCYESAYTLLTAFFYPLACSIVKVATIVINIVCFRQYLAGNYALHRVGCPHFAMPSRYALCLFYILCTP